MWKIYLQGSKEGIAIKSTVGKLKGSLINSGYKRKLFFDKEDYDYDEKELSFDKINIHTIVTTKKTCYSFENEYRSYIISQYKYNKNGNPIPKFKEGKNISVDLKILIEKIHVSPFANKWFLKIVKKLVSDHLKYFEPKDIIYSSSR